ncbi:replication-relaxation family protein [Paenibacillus sp. N4]|uniref:replication-relaxation family protein n=1 Tax=Paenibacillus vietnamensis TaxID=2590547 RepID=UPI001CD09FDB|nr:replication-relaxation family protein [Paenibacillus vietnamensis]MCA0754884.1 replication-relaxation family protein [Paenibacillus vietnamensis]
MIARDKAIIADLERFRVMSRDDVAELHYNHVKNPITEANKTLLRLRRDGLIGVSKERRKYLYFPQHSIKKDSQKVGHFLAILDFYKQMRRHEQPRVFDVEPKVGDKGLPEPDAFAIWKGAPFYIEIQNSIYSAKQMAEKLNRYESYYHSDEWKEAEWQPRDKKIFPYVWIVGGQRYEIGTTSFRVLQGGVEIIVNRQRG